MGLGVKRDGRARMSGCDCLDCDDLTSMRVKLVGH